LTDRLYSASQALFDPFGDLACDAASGDSAAELRTAGYGLLIWLAGATNPNADLEGLAEHGAFTVRFGTGDRIIPFWDEVANNRATSTVTIYWHESTLGRGRDVRTAETSTVQGLYLTQNAEEPLAATIRTLAELCMGFRAAGRRFADRLRAIPEVAIDDAAPAKYPTAWQTGRFVLEKLARSARLRWKARGRKFGWFVAIRPNRGASITAPGHADLAGFQDVPIPPGSAEMADPFLWETGEHTYLFFEEVATGSPKGRLTCIDLFENGARSETTIVLERDCHLSYPCVVPTGGELFLLPETSAAGTVELYRFARFPGKVELVAHLAEGVKLVDTTPFFLNDRWYFFTTTDTPFMETFLFWSDRLDGAWNLHPASPISGSARNCRSAGNLFRRDGRLYRPTQDCSVRYGYAIQVNEVVRLTPSEFEERPAAWMAPTWRPGLLGTHTWNESSRVQVLDGLRWM
jgi:hypothetical protein